MATNIRSLLKNYNHSFFSSYNQLSITSTSQTIFAIGDIQGCYRALSQLLELLPDHASIIFLGDLVNRGPQSLETLRCIMALGKRAQIVLGNHDLHFIARAHGIRPAGRRDTLDTLLNAPDLSELVDWLRQQPLALWQNGFLCIHAGVLPQWDLAQTLTLANEVEQHLRSQDYVDFLSQIFGNETVCWHPNLSGTSRHRLIINALTRLRFCTADGCIDFTSKDGTNPPPNCLPWFAHQHRRTQAIPIAFGHWSTLGFISDANLISLDTGCVWGGKLSAISLNLDPTQRQLIQVPGLTK